MSKSNKGFGPNLKAAIENYDRLGLDYCDRIAQLPEPERLAAIFQRFSDGKVFHAAPLLYWLRQSHENSKSATLEYN